MKRIDSNTRKDGMLREEDLEVIGEYKSSKKSSIANVHYAQAEIFDKDGNLKAKAEAKFIEK
mgnify:CR=1 FL=1